MADVKISGLPASTTPLAGTEVLPIVQGGQTRQVSVNNLTTGKAVSATQYTSTIATGTAPLVVASTTEVANLKAANATSADTANQVKSNATTGVLQVAGPSTGTTRVMTTPDANFTAARIDAAQTFNGNQIVTGQFSVNQTTLNDGGITPAAWVKQSSDANFKGLATIAASAGGEVIHTGYDGTKFLTTVTYLAGGGAYKPYAISVNGNETVTFATNLDLNVNFGNLVIGTSGKGIDFSATAGTGTSELLADYEEGTWTPALTVGFTVVGDLTVSGTYTKIGRTVFVRGTIQATTSITSAGGDTRITGFPFTSTSSTAVVFAQDNLAYPGTGLFIGVTAGLYNPAYSAGSNTVIFTFTYIV
jgi:hypothetical protein